MDAEQKAPWVELLIDKECIICYDNKENEWLTLECRHEYHKKCIHQWMRIRMVCPICVQNIQPHHYEDEQPAEPIAEYESEENDRQTQCCERDMQRYLCSMLFLSIICIIVGSILTNYS
jgi:hypothetical protein